MGKRKKHRSKEIEMAIQYAESRGWRYRETGNSAHAWGRLLCALQAREGCGMSIWSTPRDVDNHAKHIRKQVDGCPHNHEENYYEN